MPSVDSAQESAEANRPDKPGGNPFRKSFGVLPAPELIGRTALVSRFTVALSPNPPEPDDECAMFFGPRGSGKTATLIEMADRARLLGWLVVDLTGKMENGLLAGLRATVLNTMSLLSQVQRDVALKALAVNLGRVGVKFEWGDAVRDPVEVPGTELLKALLQTAASNDTGVLMCVDEMHAADVGECAVLGNTVQDLMRKERLPLQFRGAAFPDFRRTALDDPQLSFFRRGEQVSMPPLTRYDAHQGFQLCAAESGGEFTGEALEAAVDAVEGSPYMFQLVGHYSWKASLAPTKPIGVADVERGVEAAVPIYARNVSKLTWERLSAIEQQVVMLVHQHGATHTTVELSDFVAQEGYSDDFSDAVIDGLTEDCFFEADAHDCVSLAHGTGLPPNFLNGKLEVKARRAAARRDEGAAKAVHAETPSPLSAAWPTTDGPGDPDICGAWMPRAARRCALREGHAGLHRTKPWSARR